jgi:putative sterol carrier protein
MVVRVSDATKEFFDQLSRSGNERLLKTTAGTIRFDLEHDHGIDHWLVTIADGDLRVSREDREADAVIHTDEAFFERMARGEAKPLPAWLRNDITSEGQFRLIVLLERLFPQPPSAHHPRAFARERGELK